MAQDSQSAHSEGWFIVDQTPDSSPYSRSRSPQLNVDNMSSGQVADASSDYNLAHMSTHNRAGYDDPRSTGGCVQQLVSNGYTTETGGTDDTQIKLDTIAASHQTSTAVSAIPGKYYLDQVSDTSLTPSNMERLQHQLYPSNISNWVQSAGLGHRVNRHLTSRRGSKSVSSSRSKLSTTSSVGQDWALVVPPYPMENDLAYAGDWSGEQLEQLHRAMGYRQGE